MNGIPTDRIVLKTGASTTIVHQRMVIEENYTGDAVMITDSGDSTHSHPKARSASIFSTNDGPNLKRT